MLIGSQFSAVYKVFAAIIIDAQGKTTSGFTLTGNSTHSN